MTNKLRILPLIVASVLLGAIVIQNAMASICFDCPDADVDVDVDVAEAENTTSTSSGTNQSSTGTNSTG